MKSCAQSQSACKRDRSRSRRSASVLEQHRLRIEQWLEHDLTLVRVQELLARDGVSIAYATLRRYAHDELGWRERGPTVLIDDPPPGEEAQIDYGEVGYVTTAEGKRRRLWVLIVTRRADDMTAAIVRADAKDPGINPSFAEYTQARRFFVDPARVRHPQDEPRVENQVPHVRDRWFGGESFSDDLAVLRTSAARWCVDVAGARIHGTTRRVPREVFETESKHIFRRLRQHRSRCRDGRAPRSILIIMCRSRTRCTPCDQASRAANARPRHRRTVRIHAGNDLVKTHPRVGPGKRSTDIADSPVGAAPYARRSVDGIIAKGREHGEHVGIYAERLTAPSVRQDVCRVRTRPVCLSLRIQCPLPSCWTCSVCSDRAGSTIRGRRSWPSQSAVERFKNNAYQCRSVSGASDRDCWGR